VLTAALGLVESQGPDPAVVIAGGPAAEPALRDGLEAAYRDLAGYASSRAERTHLVDQANEVRRWTLL
jgi:serine/threonine-protein kinase PknG